MLRMLGTKEILTRVRARAINFVIISGRTVNGEIVGRPLIR